MSSIKTWNEENKIISDLLAKPYIRHSAILKNCIVDTIDFRNEECEDLILENCVINTFQASMTHFYGKCLISNCIFNEEFSLEAGGHNKREFRIEGSIFRCFANFFDAYFEESFVLENNIFIDHTNLLAYKGQSYAVAFKGGSVIAGNIGKLDADVNYYSPPSFPNS